MIQAIPTAAGVVPSGGAVGGASNLTTVGAVPYVSATGVLNQDQTAGGQFFWDSTNHRLGVGTAAPATRLDIRGAVATIVANFWGNDANNSISISDNAGVDAVTLGSIAAGNGYLYAPASKYYAIYAGAAERLRAAPSGNILIGGTTDGNFRLGVQSSGSSGTARFYDQTAVTGTTLVVIRAGAGQGSAQEFQVQANDGTAKLGMHYNGVTTYVQNANSSYLTIGSDRIYSEYPPAGTNGGTHYLGSTGAVKWDSSTGLGGADLGLARNAIGVVEVNSGVAGTYRDLKLRSLVGGGTAPAVSSGSIVTGSTNVAGQINSATTGAFTCIITFTSTAPTGWSIHPSNMTTANLIRQSASSTTTATITGTTVSGDVISYVAVAF